MPQELFARATSTDLADRAAVSVSLVDLGAGPEELCRAEAVLSPDERARARRGTPSVHRRRVLLRAALRAALGEELGVHPAAVRIGTSATGRPFPIADGRPLLDANCSASGDVGVIALGRACRLGIDVEGIAPWSSDLLDEGWLADTEQAALQRLPLGERAIAATRSWTQKEAVLKARGAGLLDDPRAVVTSVGRDTGLVAGWAVHDVPVPAGWVASLAISLQVEPPS